MTGQARLSEIRRDKRGALFAFAVWAACIFVMPSAHAGGGAPKFVDQPTINQNPNPRAPLPAILRFKTNEPVSTHVELDDGDRRWTIDFTAEEDPSKGLIVLGMRPGRTHKLEVSITDADGSTTKARRTLTYSTPPLPPVGKEFPTIDVKKATPDRMEPGVTILSVRRRAIGRPTWLTPAQMSFSRNWSLLLALDAEGEVVWYYISDKRIAGVDRLHNGNLFFHLADFRSVEIDMLGNVVGEWYAENRPDGRLTLENAVPIKGIQTLHHQPHEMPNGDFLAFTGNTREIPNYYTSETNPKAPRKTQTVMGDSAIIFSKDGEIKWRWDAFDHLDTNRIGYGLTDPYWQTRGFKDTLDWTHGNGLGYDEARDEIMISLRLQDAILGVDHKSGDIKWILGDHKDWRAPLKSKLLTPVGDDFRWPYHAHNPRTSYASTIVVFDNGILQARPFDKPLPPNKTYSRGVEYEIDEDAMTVRQVWASDYELTEDSCNGWAMGDAHRLPKTDNMLVIFALCVPYVEGLTFDEYDATHRHVDEFPNHGRVREYTRTTPAEILFDVDILDTDDMLQWEVYGGLRAPSLYPKDE